jgi:hypothetical protein
MSMKTSRRRFPFVVALAAAWLASPAPGRDEPQGGGAARKPAATGHERIDGEAMLRHVRYLAAPELEGRAPDTEGSQLAIAYLVRQFQGLALEGKGDDGFRQGFRRGGKTLTNVVARLEGSDPDLRDEYLVIGAHFDHLGVRDGVVHPGADDNASGCAALLEIARAMKDEGAPRRSILFVAFDGEEIGLLGAKHFVKEPPVPKKKLVAMINLDMVSRGPLEYACVCGTSESAALEAAVTASAAQLGVRVEDKYEREWRLASDHGAFAAEKIPWLYFGVEDHEDYHRPSDTADKAQPAKMEQLARFVYLVARAVADAESRPKWREAKAAPRKVKPKAEQKSDG